MLKIQVTKNDIKQGLKKSGYHCAVALATNRAIKKKYKNFNYPLLVCTDTLYTGVKSKFKLPKKVRKFIHDFDWSSKGVKPISFCLPEKYLKEVNHAES